MSTLKSLIYPAVAIAFVALLAFGIYRKTSVAVAPPLYDALSYYEKAFSVWTGWSSESKKINPFYAEPVIRPPGSVPVTAPWGINSSKQCYQWFYFRNIFVPIILWMGACFIAFPLKSRDSTDRALKVALIGALGMLPMFFNMEYNEQLDMGYWGMQDTLLAAVAALALALTLRGLETRSVVATAAGVALSGYSLWIKPSGFLVMLVVVAFWCGEQAFRLWVHRNETESRRLDTRYAARAFPFLLGVPAIFGWLAVDSPYLTGANIALAREAQEVVIAMCSTLSVSFLAILSNRSVGYIWTILFAAFAVYAVAVTIAKKKRILSVAGARIFLSGMALLCALYWWYRMAGPVERYMFPFVLLAVVGVGNPIWNLLVRELPVASKRGIAALFGMMAIIGLAILLHGSPSNRTQKFLGINLSSGRFKSAISAGKYIVSKSRALPGNINVYAPNPSSAAMGTAFIESFLTLENWNGHKFTILHPFPWGKKSTISAEQLFISDYILLNHSEEIPAEEPGRPPGDFWREMDVVKRFLKSLDAADGIRKVFFSGGLCVIEVLDRDKLRKAFTQMADTRAWRNEFYDENNKWREWESAFNQASDIAYSASSDSPDKNLSPNSPLKLLAGSLPGDFVVEAAVPSILVPPFLNNGCRHALVKIELSVPSPKTQRIFYRENREPAAGEEVVSAECGRGNNILFFKLPLTGDSTLLRMEVGGEPGRNSLKSIEIRRVR